MLSVVVTRLEKIDSIFTDAVYQAVFLGDPPRPAACEYKLQGLRFADTRKPISKYRFNQFQDSKRCLSIGFHPISQVLPELRVEHSRAFGPSRREFRDAQIAGDTDHPNPSDQFENPSVVPEERHAPGIHRIGITVHRVGFTGDNTQSAAISARKRHRRRQRLSGKISSVERTAPIRVLDAV